MKWYFCYREKYLIPGLLARSTARSFAGPMSIGKYEWRGNWCGRRGSNSDGLPRRNLNPVRLPVPPRPRGRNFYFNGSKTRNRFSGAGT